MSDSPRGPAADIDSLAQAVEHLHLATGSLSRALQQPRGSNDWILVEEQPVPEPSQDPKPNPVPLSSTACTCAPRLALQSVNLGPAVPGTPACLQPMCWEEKRTLLRLRPRSRLGPGYTWCCAILAAILLLCSPASLPLSALWGTCPEATASATVSLPKVRLGLSAWPQAALTPHSSNDVLGLCVRRDCDTVCRPSPCGRFARRAGSPRPLHSNPIPARWISPRSASGLCTAFPAFARQRRRAGLYVWSFHHPCRCLPWRRKRTEAKFPPAAPWRCLWWTLQTVPWST